jgi:hypothetical protein
MNFLQSSISMKVLQWLHFIKEPYLKNCCQKKHAPDKFDSVDDLKPYTWTEYRIFDQEMFQPLPVVVVYQL